MSGIVDEIARSISERVNSLSDLWQKIGYRTEVRNQRKNEVIHYFVKLSDDMLKVCHFICVLFLF